MKQNQLPGFMKLPSGWVHPPALLPMEPSSAFLWGAFLGLCVGTRMAESEQEPAIED